MKYISSDERQFTLQIDASIHKNMKHFALIEKKYILDEKHERTLYDLYEITEEEAREDFQSETLESFATKYLEQEKGEKVEITNVEIYINGENVSGISKRIQVLVFEPDKPAYTKEINQNRNDYKRIVEGDTEFVTLGGEYILVCNEVGMLIKLPQNRGFHGTFFIAKNIEGYCDNLTPEDVELLKNEFDNKQNFESKSKYLQEYFQNNPIERQVFNFTTENSLYSIGTESIIAYLLGQEKKEQLQLIELEVRAIEREGGDIIPYLKQIGKQMANKNSHW